MVVPFAAGGPTDVVARLIGAKVGESLGQQVVIENVLGASGNIGTRNVARAAPDGYTLLVTASGFVVNPSLYASNPYDAIKDFAPITVAASAPNVLIVHPSVPAKTVKELVEFVQANPGKHNFASAGVGQTGHLAGELLKISYKLDLAHVPFAGGAPIMNSMMGGHTLIAFLSLPSAAAYIRDGRVRALAVTVTKRSSVCRKCRPWRKPVSPNWRRNSSRASWRRPERQRTSSSVGMPRSSRLWSSRTCRSGSPP